MARSLSNMLMKSISSSTQISAIVSKSFYINGLKYSTTVPYDPDTHEDFRSISKLEKSNLDLKDIVEQDIKENPVMIYMKGVPDLPRCGFSSLAVRVLKEYSKFAHTEFYDISFKLISFMIISMHINL